MASTARARLSTFIQVGFWAQPWSVARGRGEAHPLADGEAAALGRPVNQEDVEPLEVAQGDGARAHGAAGELSLRSRVERVLSRSGGRADPCPAARRERGARRTTGARAAAGPGAPPPPRITNCVVV